MAEALTALQRDVARRSSAAAQAAIDVQRAALDLQLRHVPQPEVDLKRLAPWARQVLVDRAAGDRGGVAGDIATMEAILARTGAGDAGGRQQVQQSLEALRAAVDAGNLGAVSGGIPAVLSGLVALGAD